MKKILTIMLAAAMLISASACGNKDEEENLSPDEIKARANIADNAKNGQDGEKPTEEAEDNTENSDRAKEIKKILEDMPVGELSEYVDKAEDDYKSFELLPIDSTDFFLGKTLKLVATVEDHQMSFVEQANMKAEITNEYLSITYPDSENEGEEIKVANYVYAVSEPVKSSGGCQYAIVAFGDHELTTENSDYNLDCVALIKMRDDVDMGESKAENYVLLIENGFPDRYEIFKVE